ncbi:hypothetical protein [Tessaracoccus caeni]|uniref:hypothetical protein n=1 Tax=Tessaracoccus caeni TaxID=3031239 RepID=UPI0023DCB8D7|nr:hypothetical protein [Tessaracoccus caeni]MDF1490130.1 hypothetical protein [Tessaracoccus caeni]
MIDWGALGQVALVTLFGALAIVGIVSLATRYLEYAAEGKGRLYSVAGYALLLVTAAIVLFGLYLLIPYFHH